MALFAYKHQFARDELVNDVDLLGLSLCSFASAVEVGNDSGQYICKLSEEDCAESV